MTFQTPQTTSPAWWGALCLAALQMAAAASLGSVGALLDIEDYTSRTHVESPDSANCPLSHDHPFCQVVRSLSKANIRPAASACEVIPLSVRVPDSTAVADCVFSAAAISSPVIPRAPPSA